MLFEGDNLSQIEDVSKWRRVLVRIAVFLAAVILADFVVVYFFGSQIWSYAGYFCGSDIRTTIGVLLFVEGAVSVGLGVVRGGGSITSIGPRSGRNYGYTSLDERKQHGEQTKEQDVIGIVLMLTGGLLLITCFILFFA